VVCKRTVTIAKRREKSCPPATELPFEEMNAETASQGRSGYPKGRSQKEAEAS